ncbi:PspC domain-containing protein [Actinocorallia sp. A-T 12471]|uniref:PspC domain-containing protein n=1 Tax=Actinocorallia sp. A-T 12471 TaxID=3089813 RepID=UPI0029CB5D0C|nr:PspC domain-containing protein [Actinocorallia sp. A-T 12471]MDX6744452.1 PspC domain-containing protein [Actinocorallia sp. A-T 12471]
MTTDRLARGAEGRLVAGVCTGIGRYTGIDPLVFRIGWGVLVFVTWTAIPLYVLAAVLMAEPGGGPGVVERSARRVIPGSAVLALLGIALAGGVILDVVLSGAAGGLDAGALGAMMILLLIGMIAQTRGVDLVETARTLPERLRGEPLTPQTVPAATASAATYAGPSEWIDLATLRPIPAQPPSGVQIDLNRMKTPEAPVEPSGATSPQPPRRRGTPWLTLTTLVLAGAAAWAVSATRLNPDHLQQLALSAALAVVGLGLVAGTWFGRPRGLVGVGALLSMALLASAATTELPPGSRFGDVEWRPVDPNATTQPYRLVAGNGTLDLTTLALNPGDRYRVDAKLGVGGIRIVLPAHARVELHAATNLGDITVEKKINSGPRARVDQVLDGSGQNPPTLEVHVKGMLGDVEVIRGGG